MRALRVTSKTHFYPRSPCGERHGFIASRQLPTTFLSTLSLRRATNTGGSKKMELNNFYPRSPCGERPRRYPVILGREISIHALLAESDREPTALRTPHHRFLSTLSLRRATARRASRQQPAGISIHALLAESDRYILPYAMSNQISIHALLAESDALSQSSAKSTPEISIHALLAESDSKSAQNSGALLRIWNKFYGDCIFMLTGKAVFYPFCPCFFHIFWCEGSGNFMIAFPSH